MSVVLDLREVLLAELGDALLEAFPAVLGGLDEEFRDHVAGRALVAGLDAGACMRMVATAAVMLATLDPEPLPASRPGSPIRDSGEELARAAVEATAALLHVSGVSAVRTATNKVAEAHGLDPCVVPVDELLGDAEARAAYGAGVDRMSRLAAGRVGGRR